MTMPKTLEKIFNSLKERRWARNSVGVLLVIGGLLGSVLPLLGVWMIPLGLVLLAVDFPWAQRLSERLQHWWQRLKTKYQR